MISNISSKVPATPEFSNAVWTRSREKYQEAVRQIQQKTDQVKASLSNQLEMSIQRVRSKSDSSHTKLSFNVRKDTHRIVVTVMNSETNQVIRQIPPESMLRVSEEIQKVIGSLIDHRA